MPERFSSTLGCHTDHLHNILRLQRNGRSHAGSPHSNRGDFHAGPSCLDFHPVRTTAHVRLGSNLLLLRHLANVREEDREVSLEWSMLRMFSGLEYSSPYS